MKATRREALIAALAVPAAAGVPTVARATAAVTVYDPDLASAPPAGARAVTGDPVRFAQHLVAGRPSAIFGITRHADALLIADVAREAGYVTCRPPAALGEFGWALTRRD